MNKHNPILLVVLTLVTFGIYELFWLKETRDQMVKLGAKIPRFAVLFAPIAILLGVLILQLIVRYALSASAVNSPDLATAPSSLQTGINLISIIVGVAVVIGILPLTLYWMYRYAEGVEFVTAGQAPTVMTFLIGFGLSAIGLHFIWPGIVQSYLNGVDEHKLQSQPYVH